MQYDLEPLFISRCTVCGKTRQSCAIDFKGCVSAAFIITFDFVRRGIKACLSSMEQYLCKISIHNKIGINFYLLV